MMPPEERIPARPSPRAPPAPRSLEPPPPPHYEKQKKKQKPRKQKTRKQFKRSQIKMVVFIIIMFIFYIACIYLALTQYTRESSYNMGSNLDQYEQSFNVPNLMDQNIPVRVEVSTSNEVEILVLNRADYNENLDILDLRTLSISGSKGKSTSFVFTKDLAPGEYSIVTYAEDNDREINHDYKITTYYLMPFLGLISLLFIVPIIIALVWIFVLQRKKSDAPEDHDQYHEHYGRSDPYHHNDQNYDYRGYAQDYTDDGYGPEPPRSPPPARSDTHYDADYHNDGYQDHHEPYPSRRAGAHLHPQQHAPPPRPPRPPRKPTPPPVEDWRGSQQGSRAPPPQRPKPRQDYPEDTPEEKATTVPCKCGEIIVITDPTRPLRIRCPRCGRRGILEGKLKAPEEDIFY